MRTHFVVTLIFTVLLLAACGSSPSAVEAEQAKGGIPPTTAASTNSTETVATADDAGLGAIVYDDRTRNACKRQARPGSRIHRNSCEYHDPFETKGADISEKLTRAPINQRRVAK